ncbi:hypothetical protein C8Q76DRAFT_687841 [Earliella scabrosa]|nr:hypothetical protein C8Q76DRAFT_687841 [Earliella scabrosa]
MSPPSSSTCPCGDDDPEHNEDTCIPPLADFPIDDRHLAGEAYQRDDPRPADKTPEAFTVEERLWLGRAIQDPLVQAILNPVAPAHTSPADDPSGQHVPIRYPISAPARMDAETWDNYWRWWTMTPASAGIPAPVLPVDPTPDDLHPQSSAVRSDALPNDLRVQSASAAIKDIPNSHASEQDHPLEVID